MLRFPFAKINLGLNICSRRSDTYHEIETAIFPIDLCDALEILPADRLSLRITGNDGDVLPDSSNTCIKAWNILKEAYGIDPVEMILLKKIPSGAGLGGGSSNGASTLVMLSELFKLGLSSDTLRAHALQIGSDCPFFIDARPALAKGRGEILDPLEDVLKNRHIVLIKPPFSISTAGAYAACEPQDRSGEIRQVLSRPDSSWKTDLKNDFEPQLFVKHPILAEIKKRLYESGAGYASLSGSGSVVYGLFEKKPASDTFSDLGTVFQVQTLNR